MTKTPGPLGIPGRTELYELMTSKGAPRRCSVTADYDPRWRELELSAAIDEVVGSGTYAAVVSSIPGALAYVENESGRFLLERARL